MPKGGDETFQAGNLEIIETREITAVLQTASTNFNVNVHSDVYKWLLKLGTIIYTIALHFDTSLIVLDLDSRSQECENAEHSAPIILKSFQSVLTEFDLLLRRARVMNLIHILSCPFNIQGREPYL